ncbi:MAG: MoaD/ThiS family protein [Pseudanabaenaceae cyanobacterium bins.68]|nr:MoaD/ThiS family protein [Pseudanabaenaceae cyanobacterium bins.68]
MSPSLEIKVTLKLFAIFAEVIGQSELELTLNPNTTVEQALELILQKYPSLTSWRSRLRYGVNLEFVTPDHQLQAGDQVVFIPPVSGG